MGYGFSILAISLAIKTFFVPIQVMAVSTRLTKQVQGIKTRLLSAEMKEFQEKMKKLSRTGEYGAIKEEKAKLNVLRKSHGISTSIQMLTLTQIPFLMTWFLSLRYMLGNPDIFPGLETGRLA
jgi:YidC/Oxa1 family membrane protein insertase